MMEHPGWRPGRGDLRRGASDALCQTWRFWARQRGGGVGFARPAPCAVRQGGRSPEKAAVRSRSSTPAYG